LELATEIRTPLFLAHVCAGTGTPVQQTNCHPFRYRNWLFVHNGYVAGYDRLRRDLLMAVRPDLFGNIAGSTDSELLFHLALTFGLTDDPIAGIARMAGFVEAIAAAADLGEPALQMTVGVSDGARLYADDEPLVHFGDDARVVVSEPLTDLPGLWREVPAGTALIVGEDIEEQAFQPISPAAA
jgi:predicted glutamine amidotransferase